MTWIYALIWLNNSVSEIEIIELPVRLLQGLKHKNSVFPLYLHMLPLLILTYNASDLSVIIICFLFVLNVVTIIDVAIKRDTR
jgi:hypothetical protein